jgi:hypothetical protein
VSTLDSTSYRPSWLERFAPLGGIIFAVWVLVGFFTSDDYDDTPQSVIAYADSDETNLWLMAALGLATPLLVGWFVAGLAARLRAADPLLRTLVVVGGSVFIALVSVGVTIWSAPLLDDSLDETSAATYLLLDDFGWVIIGAGGVAMGVLIVAASLAALRLGWVPSWLGWLSVAFGVVAFASVAAVGLFAWIAWLIIAGTLMLVRGGSRTPSDPPISGSPAVRPGG